jgi:hypothetical protein
MSILLTQVSRASLFLTPWLQSREARRAENGAGNSEKLFKSFVEADESVGYSLETGLITIYRSRDKTKGISKFRQNGTSQIHLLFSVLRGLSQISMPLA